MKTTLALIALCLAAQQSFGQGAQGAQITQRARDVVKENNARQGVQPKPAQPPAAARASTAPTPATPAVATPAQMQQLHVARIRSDITDLCTGAEVSKAETDKLAADLLSAARGTAKPSPASLNKFASSLAKQLAGKTLESADELRLAQNLEALVNSSVMSKLQANAYIYDIQAVLEAAGVPKADAEKTGNDARAVLAEVRR